LLFYDGKWWKPHGTTPTTHIFKTQIGTLPNGIDLSNSVENEYYCLNVMAAFGLPVNAAKMKVFGKTKVLVVERFDRKWTAEGWLLRVAQEDYCQALSVPPGRKYQNGGGKPAEECYFTPWCRHFGCTAIAPGGALGDRSTVRKANVAWASSLCSVRAVETAFSKLPPFHGEVDKDQGFNLGNPQTKRVCPESARG
jgi:Rieske Fe-S protein